jgi:hypothetical protein
MLISIGGKSSSAIVAPSGHTCTGAQVPSGVRIIQTIKEQYGAYQNGGLKSQRFRAEAVNFKISHRNGERVLLSFTIYILIGVVQKLSKLCHQRIRTAKIGKATCRRYTNILPMFFAYVPYFPTLQTHHQTRLFPKPSGMCHPFRNRRCPGDIEMSKYLGNKFTHLHDRDIFTNASSRTVSKLIRSAVSRPHIFKGQ